MPDSDATRSVPRAQPAGLGLGERLRSARKARAISVAQAADSLRLEESTVLALEEERFGELGAPVFVRGHLKRYAELVGLRPDVVLDAYRIAVPESDALPLISRPREQAEGLSVGPWVYWLAAGLVGAGMLLALATGRQKPATPEPGPAPSVDPSAVTAPAAAPAPAPATTTAPASDPSPAPDSATLPVPVTQPVPDAAPAPASGT
jgi:cytoskeletal protein RodZ